MKLIQVRSKDASDKHRTVFDQVVGKVVGGEPTRVIIRADGKAHWVQAGNKLVKDAIDRGELVAVDPDPDEAVDAKRSESAAPKA